MKTTVINIKQAPKGWENDTQFVYIGRAGRGHDGYFGNPYRIQEGQDRGSTLDKYTKYLVRRVSIDTEFYERVKELSGKTLVCFCKPNPCHGDILAEMSDRLKETEGLLP